MNKQNLIKKVNLYGRKSIFLQYSAITSLKKSQNDKKELFKV